MNAKPSTNDRTSTSLLNDRHTNISDESIQFDHFIDDGIFSLFIILFALSYYIDL